MKKLKIFIVITIGIITLGIITLIVLSSLPMGKGSESFARKWTSKLKNIESVNEFKKEYPEESYIELPSGDWAVGVSSDSHASPWGGTVVIKDSSGNTRSFFGHVCGSRYLTMFFNDKLEHKNLEDLYKFTDNFKEHIID